MEVKENNSKELLISKDEKNRKESKTLFFKGFFSNLGVSIIFLFLSIITCFIIYYANDIGIDYGIIPLSICGVLLFASFITKLGEHIRSKTVKQKIEQGNMIKIYARIIGFQRTAIFLNTIYYKIICSDGISKFYSEELAGKVHDFSDEFTHFEDISITYDPYDPLKTLHELENNTKKEFNYGYNEVEDELRGQTSQGYKPKQPYGIFNEKKINIGDSINVYINPENRKSYRVDTSFLK